jgi:hypothetical protein
MPQKLEVIISITDIIVTSKLPVTQPMLYAFCYGRAPVGPIVDRIKGLAQVI